MDTALVGTWKLRPEKSEFGPNHRPSAATMVFEIDADGNLLLTAEGANEKGEKVSERPQKFVPDGKPHPLPGLPGLTAVATLEDPHRLSAEVRREDGSLVGTWKSVVSEDGKSLTVTNSGWDSQLREFKQTTAWERA